MTTRATTVRDAVALITGALADPEPAIDRTLDQIIEDLEQAEPIDVITAFAAFTTGLARDLALVTGECSEDIWQLYVDRITRNLTGGN
ncbi:hypothetical protein AB0O67_24350 [Streptomyces sp. NPDC086077]|uniref:hypothetical protein n=1 Tax=Streptomyces sp. NPDC086077 TaxID=3154862 RepID=UPI0034334395